MFLDIERRCNLNRCKLMLFLSGLFFGGAIDHLILAGKGSKYTLYGIRSGRSGNWLLAIVDGGLAILFYLLQNRLEHLHKC